MTLPVSFRGDAACPEPLLPAGGLQQTREELTLAIPAVEGKQQVREDLMGSF